MLTVTLKSILIYEKRNDVTTFEAVDKIPWCYHLNETSCAVLYAWHYSFLCTFKRIFT